MMMVSLRDVEEGIEHARTTANPHSLDLATAEHERPLLLLRTKAVALNRSSETPRAGIRGTAGTLREHEARLTSLEAQNRSTAVAIAVAERNHTTYISQLCSHSRQPPPVPVAQQPPASAKLATSVAPAAQQSPASTNNVTTVAPAAQQPASANLVTFVAPTSQQPLAPATSTVSTALAATQPLPPATSAVSTALAATRPLGTTVPATSRPSATTAPAFTFSARPNMPPPAPRDPSTSTPWSVVVLRAHQQPPGQPPSAAHDDTYLELRISKLMFKNRHFPSYLRLPIKELASDVNTALYLLYGGRCRLRYALELATQDRTLLSDRLVEGILHLRDILERAYGTPDGARWVRETLRDTGASPRPDRAESSVSASSTTTGQRRREEPSIGRGNAKRATLSGTSDSDSHQHPRRAGRDHLDRRQVPPRIFHAAGHNDSDAPPFPPRIPRHREHTQRLPPRVENFSIEDAPGADSPPSLQHMVEAVTAAAIAAVDRHLAHMGLYPRSKPASSQDFMNHARPLVAPASVATPPPPAGSMIPTTHPAAVSTDNAYPFVTPASVVTPPPLTGSVAPTTHPAVVSTNSAYPVATPPPVSAPLPPVDSVAPTVNPVPTPTRIAPPLRPHSLLL